MALESATYINQLVSTNPTGVDPKGQGDDHLRLIKSVLKTTFPNITGAVTTTQDQLNSLTAPNVLLVSGMIMMWSGNIAALPAGWLLCNGSGTITGGLTVPDLRDKFIVGAGSAYTVRATGGAATHDHTLSLALTPTALTLAQIPAHTHSLPTDASGSSNIQSLTHTNNSDENPTGGVTGSAGSGQPHTHGITGDVAASSNLPPYYALAFIIKQ